MFHKYNYYILIVIIYIYISYSTTLQTKISLMKEINNLGPASDGTYTHIYIYDPVHTCKK